jgi:hypothetical protein
LFAGKFGVSIEDHLTDFLKVMDDCDVEHEDVVMRMFVQILKGDGQACYKLLPAGSIDGWDVFQDKFTERWDDKQDTAFLLKTFSTIKKEENEIVFEFNTRYSKAYNRIPNIVSSNAVGALFFYLQLYDGIFGIAFLF